MHEQGFDRLGFAEREVATADARLRSVARSGLATPEWASRVPSQTAIVVADASGSMVGSKARDAQAAILALVAELAIAANRDAFSVAVVSFDESARRRLTRMKASRAVSGLNGLDLVAGHGCRTNVTVGLEAAEAEVDAAVAEGESARPVVILFSDGGHNHGPEPDAVATRLRQRADLVTIAYQDGDEQLLRRLATTPQHFTRCQDGPTLRSFLAAVGSTMSRSARRGNASEALAALAQMRR